MTKEEEKLIFRKATYGDLNCIFAIECESQIKPWTLEMFKSSLHTKNNIFLLEKLDTLGIINIIGFIIFAVNSKIDEVNIDAPLQSKSTNKAEIQNTNDIECEILNFSIIPKERRNGYGALLLTRSLKEVKTQGVNCVFLEVRESNKPALELYKKNGFNLIGKRKNYYAQTSISQQEDAIVLKLKLR